ncbi:hypothetical protein SLA2020_160650 [Shorea laevis]
MTSTLSKRATFLNGSLHNEGTIAFDLAKETFFKITSFHGRVVKPRLGAIGGCLICWSNNQVQHFQYIQFGDFSPAPVIWVTRQYWVQETWTRLRNYSHKPQDNHHRPHFFGSSEDISPDYDKVFYGFYNREFIVK